MPHIVLITTKQPSSNPRLVKEAVALAGNGYAVTVVYNYWSDWAAKADQVIFKHTPGINWIMAGPDPAASKYSYWVTRLRFKLFKILGNYLTNNLWVHINAATQFYPELKKKGVGIQADLYIAHNTGALAVAALAAKKNKTKFAFDAEDFHRSQEGEYTVEGRSAKYLEDTFFNAAAYITTASPLIAEEYKKCYPGINFLIINNVFSKQYQSALRTIDAQPLKLFWFSQTVGLKRGVQDVIAAMNLIVDAKLKLTILGDVSNSVKHALTSILHNTMHQIEFMQPCNERQLFKVATEHHIGLALEPGFSLNNNIALSNKLFTYLLAGNAVIFSDTAAQQMFYKEHPEVGWCYKAGDTEALKLILTGAAANETALNAKRKSAWMLAAEKFNWETEQQSFLQLVKSVI